MKATNTGHRKNIVSYLLIAVMSISIFSACSSSQKLKNGIMFQTLLDKDKKMLKGRINSETLEKDTAFKWFAENMKYVQVDTAAVTAFRNKTAKFSMVVFGGTWCEDTQALLPQFYKLVRQSGYPESKIALYAVDRQKVTLNNVNATYNISRVPTFIVLDNSGKEVGRVVEYGKNNNVPAELADLVKNL
jgi:thiol-disulfide isomerase/thioredoxin